MRRFFIILLFCLPMTAFAQVKVLNNPNYDRKWIHFGFTVGINTMDFGMNLTDDFLHGDGDGGNEYSTVYGIENQRNLGFHLGPVVNFRLGEYFDFRPLINLSFGQRNLQYKVAQDTLYGEAPFKNHIMQIESIFLEIPLHIKYKAKRHNNYRPYVVGGVNTKYDFAARKKIKDEEKPKIRLRPFDVYWELGFGIDFYLPYFKFSTEIKFAMGTLNMINYDQTEYTTAIDRLNSKMVLLSFHFE